MNFELSSLALAVGIVVQPLVDSEVLEPSVRNEVEHALARAPAMEGSKAGVQPLAYNLLPFQTNGMSRTDIAIRLVSSQKPDGRWLVGTNDVTAAAIMLLKSL